MKQGQKPVIIALSACLIISMCANFYAYCILPEKQWEEADALTWTAIDPSYFTGQVSTPVSEEVDTAEGVPEVTPAPAKKTTKPSLQYEGATVYVTKSGTKYHRDSCSSLSKSKIPMLYEEAKADGYSPCGKCNP